jgi:hypothetical protein
MNSTDPWVRRMFISQDVAFIAMITHAGTKNSTIEPGVNLPGPLAFSCRCICQSEFYCQLIGIPCVLSAGSTVGFSRGWADLGEAYILL